MRARRERVELRDDRVVHVVLEQRELHAAAREPALGAELGGGDVVRLEIRIGRRERRAGGDELIQLRRGREAVRLGQRRRERPVLRRVPGQQPPSVRTCSPPPSAARRVVEPLTFRPSKPRQSSYRPPTVSLRSGVMYQASCAHTRLRLRLAVTLGEHARAAAAVRPVGRVVRRVLQRVALVVHARAERVRRELTARLPRPLEVERAPARAVEHRDAAGRLEGRPAGRRRSSACAADRS